MSMKRFLAGLSSQEHARATVSLFRLTSSDVFRYDLARPKQREQQGGIVSFVPSY
ncbi:MAG: hypothetical protein AAF417_15715 [Pseudomonadota bacterium]